MVKVMLPNGLTIHLLKKAGFVGQFATVMVDFGGLDRKLNHHVSLPVGTAHFIEHQLFNKHSGDISARFAAHQASTNAFTSPSKTAYYFESAGHLLENLDLLAELVGQAYFKAASVQNERGIIGQEIDLYQDQPDWQLETGLMQKLFKNQPLADDIAGSKTSIDLITPDILTAAYQAYYQPQRMQVVVVGDFSITQLQRYFKESENWAVLGQAKAVLPGHQEKNQSTSTPLQLTTTQVTKLALGWRMQAPMDLATAIGWQLDLELILTILFGETSSFLRKYRDRGLIDDRFQFQTIVERSTGYLLMTMNTPDPQKCQAVIKQALADMATTVTAAQFARVQKQVEGQVLFSRDSLSDLGLETAELAFYQWSPAQVARYLHNRNRRDCLAQVQTFIENSQVESFQLLGGD